MPLGAGAAPAGNGPDQYNGKFNDLAHVPRFGMGLQRKEILLLAFSAQLRGGRLVQGKVLVQ